MIFGMITPAFAANGPVILGGDDQGEHGSGDGLVNFLGWLYSQRAVENIIMFETAPGAITTDILAFGSSDPAPHASHVGFVSPDVLASSNAGAMMHSVADVLGLSIQFCDGTGVGPGTVDTCFTDLASGAIKPRMLWLAGSDTGNDLSAAEGAVLTANAALIDSFVASGGGLLSHGLGTTAYGWLNALLPAINDINGCTSNGAFLTAAGIAALPMLTNADISSGPCHNHFTGDFGNLVVFGFDGASTPRAFIIGLVAGTITGGGITGGSSEVSGELSPIDTSALLIAGAQSSMFSLVSVLSLLGAIGIGAFYYNKKRN